MITYIYFLNRYHTKRPLMLLHTTSMCLQYCKEGFALFLLDVPSAGFIVGARGIAPRPTMYSVRILLFMKVIVGSFFLSTGSTNMWHIENRKVFEMSFKKINDVMHRSIVENRHTNENRFQQCKFICPRISLLVHGEGKLHLNDYYRT